jgi:hypothetical protein
MSGHTYADGIHDIATNSVKGRNMKPANIQRILETDRFFRVVETSSLSVE